jgi:hypothetical protein
LPGAPECRCSLGRAKAEERDVRQLVAPVLPADQALGAVLNHEQPVSPGNLGQRRELRPAAEEMGDNDHTSAWSDRARKRVRPWRECLGVEIDGQRSEPMGLGDPHHVRVSDGRECDLVAGRERDSVEKEFKGGADGQADERLRVAPSAQEAIFAVPAADADAGGRSEQEVGERKIDPKPWMEVATRPPGFRS